MRQLNQQSAFTLAELLIALAILGVIATFTIPKILDSGTSAEFNAKAKEFAATLSGSYQAYKLQNSASGNTSFGDLSPYINYVAIDTVNTIDNVYSVAPLGVSCNGANRECLVLHNGAKVYLASDVAFGGTDVTNAMFFYFDPDGQLSTTTTSPGRSIAIWLYYNGKVRTWVTLDPNTRYYRDGGLHTQNPSPAFDPPWFSWSN